MLTEFYLTLVSPPTKLIQEYKGISYRKDGKLSMRLDPNCDKDAKQILYNYTEEELADMIYYNNEEKNSRKIAKSIKIKVYAKLKFKLI